MEFNQFLDKCAKAHEIQGMIPDGIETKTCDGYTIGINIDRTRHQLIHIEPARKEFENYEFKVPSQKQLQCIVMKLQNYSWNELTIYFSAYLQALLDCGDESAMIQDVLEMIPEDALNLDEVWLDFTYLHCLAKVWNPEEKRWNQRRY